MEKWEWEDSEVDLIDPDCRRDCRVVEAGGCVESKCFEGPFLKECSVKTDCTVISSYKQRKDRSIGDFKNMLFSPLFSNRTDLEADVTPSLSSFSLSSPKPDPGDFLWKQRQEWKLALLLGLYSLSILKSLQHNKNEVQCKVVTFWIKQLGVCYS